MTVLHALNSLDSVSGRGDARALSVSLSLSLSISPSLPLSTPLPPCVYLVLSLSQRGRFRIRQVMNRGATHVRWPGVSSGVRTSILTSPPPAPPVPGTSRVTTPPAPVASQFWVGRGRDFSDLSASRTRRRFSSLPRKIERSNRLFHVHDLYWRSPEFGS